MGTPRLTHGNRAVNRMAQEARLEITTMASYGNAARPNYPTTTATQEEAREWLAQQPDLIRCPIGGGCQMRLAACKARQRNHRLLVCKAGHEMHQESPRFVSCSKCEHYELGALIVPIAQHADRWESKPTRATKTKRPTMPPVSPHQETFTTANLIILFGINGRDAKRIRESSYGPQFIFMSHPLNTRIVPRVTRDELIRWLSALEPGDMFYKYKNRLEVFNG
jgi:hypothetical protein